MFGGVVESPSKIGSSLRAGSITEKKHSGECALRGQSLGNLKFSPKPPSCGHSAFAFPHLPALLTCLIHEPDSISHREKSSSPHGCNARLCCSALEAHQHTTPEENNLYTCLNDTSTMVKNDVVMNPFVSGFPFPFCVPSPPLFACIISCSDNSLFCPHAHLFILPL